MFELSACYERKALRGEKHGRNRSEYHKNTICKNMFLQKSPAVELIRVYGLWNFHRDVEKAFIARQI